jgi:DNA polymerase III epsilon subunit-like protein
MGRGRGRVPRLMARVSTGQARKSVAVRAMERVSLLELAKNPRPFCVVDLETTGLNKNGNDRVFEIAAVRYDANRQVNGTLHLLIDPGVPIPPEIQQLTGITQEEVTASGIDTRDALLQLDNFIDGQMVVTYNAPFDVSMLEQERQRIGLTEPLVREYACALSAARFLLPGLKNYRLGTVANALKIPLDRAHQADADVLATGEAVCQLLSLAERKDPDPAMEMSCTKTYDRLQTWRHTAAKVLGGIESWYLVNNREILELAQYGVNPNYVSTAPLKDRVISVLRRQCMAEAIEDPDNPGSYRVRHSPAGHPLVVRLNPPYCSSCGAPAPGQWPCGHIVATARTVALDRGLVDQLDDNLAA